MIAPSAYDALVQHMTSSPTAEVCGVLLGTKAAGGTQIHSYRSLRNVAPDPLHHFALDPQEWIHCCYQERDLLGLFHSHPMTPAIPSTTDLQQLPEFAAMLSIYLIGTLLPSPFHDDHIKHNDYPDQRQAPQAALSNIPINAYHIQKQLSPSAAYAPLYHLQPAQLNISEPS